MLTTTPTNTRRAAELLSDAELLDHVHTLALAEREATARMIAVLAEFDARRLYLGQGCPSLFIYCTQILHMSEHAAYSRIEAARAARKFPILLDQLTDGSLHLTAVRLLARHLTPDNHLAVIVAARHKTKREVEELAARLCPQPVGPTTVRQLPETRIAGVPPTNSPLSSLVNDLPLDPVGETRTEPVFDHLVAAPAVPAMTRAKVKPLGSDKYELRFTVSRETHDKLCQVQNLLGHTISRGDVAAVFDRALTLLVKQLQKRKHAATDRPRARASAHVRRKRRYICATVRREVWARDGGRCAFVGPMGRCPERSRLEYHHRVPFVDGGGSTTDNLELRCRAHNAYEAARWSGVDIARDASASYAVDSSADQPSDRLSRTASTRPTRSGPSSAQPLRSCVGYDPIEPAQVSLTVVDRMGRKPTDEPVRIPRTIVRPRLTAVCRGRLDAEPIGQRTDSTDS